MPKMTPKDFFVYLGVIVTLYVGAINILQLAFAIINYLYPDTGIYGFYQGVVSISWPVAMLVIVFPIFILLSWLQNRDYRLMPEKRGLGIRKWLIYITLFVAGAVIAGDLVYLLYTFLNGEQLTIRFILKVAAVFIVAGAIFYYYIYDLRDRVASSTNKIAAWVSGIVVVALIVTGFSIFGSPFTQRSLIQDSQKVNDLQNIQYQIVNYWQKKGALPTNINDLQDPISGFIVPNDSQNGQVYEYKKNSNLGFELCANFNLESQKTAGKTAEMTAPMPVGMNYDTAGQGNWQHGMGHVCFTRTIDPKLYPVNKTQ